MVKLGAVVLMGGRAARMGGMVKGDLRIGGCTLLERAVEAASVAREIVVVGESGGSRLPDAVRVTREQPPFGGPAAAVAAGVGLLPRDVSAVLLLAGDLPFAADAVPILLAALGSRDGDAADGVRAIDRAGRTQHLLSLVRRTALDRALVALAEAGPVDGRSMRVLLAPLKLADIEVPANATMDVDTWADARAIGATGGTSS